MCLPVLGNFQKLHKKFDIVIKHGECLSLCQLWLSIFHAHIMGEENHIISCGCFQVQPNFHYLHPFHLVDYFSDLTILFT